MSVHDLRCDDCHGRENFPYVGTLAGVRVCICRVCVGRHLQQFIAWIRDFDKAHPRIKRPRNPAKPIVDDFGTTRCRECSVQLHDYQAGAPPLCADCQQGSGV